jgi:hypothetical protein
MKTLPQLALGMCVILIASSCGNNANVPKIGSGFALESNLPSESPFRKQPAGTVLKFFEWYRSNVNQLKKIQLVGKSTNADSSIYYVVNVAGTEQYLNELQKSGFVSDQYIASRRAYFKKCSEDLQKAPQTALPVKGFDIDQVMLAKDYEEDLAKIEKSTVDAENIANDEGFVTLGLPTAGRLKVKIAKEGDKWLITDIRDMRSALDQAQND